MCSLISSIILVAAFASVLGADDDHHWHYGNEEDWPELCRTGTQQSPIDLSSEGAVATIYHAFEFENYDIPRTGRVTNNGHSVAITLDGPIEEIPTITKGGLVGEYALDHLHFHWQSEHTVRGYRFPLEMHLVHYDKKYGNFSNAANYAAGVTVLGVLFDVSLDDDRDFVPLIEVMDRVKSPPNTEAVLERSITPRSFLPRNTGDYFRYRGSLTTPGCNEGVIWTVFTRTLPLSAEQVKHFESVWLDDGPLTLNYRQVQNINDREVLLRRVWSKSTTNLDGAATSFHKVSLFATIIMCVTTVFIR